MKDAFSVLSVVSPSRWKQYPGTCLFISILLLIYLYIGFKLISPGLRERSLAQFHLTCPTFIGWALNQPIPAMYNFANEIWIGNRPKNATKEFPVGTSFKHYYTWLNHYPLRVITFSWYRSMILKDVDYKFISLRSTYRNTFVETCYYLNVKDGRVYMERVY
ncbi:MAG: hypothetical protein AB7F70_03110 [Candidatus Omnitrophota bacterium]